MDTSTISSDRFRRQQDLVPMQRLAECTATVIGVGAIGRHVAIQLAALGVRQLQLVDFDFVEWSNVTTQGYLAADIGYPKVVATARHVSQIDPAVHVTQTIDRYRPKMSTGEAVFCCVDSIETRSAIWRSAGCKAAFWADGRMLGDTIRVLAVANTVGRDHYPATVFESADAQRGRCTAGGTIYAANIAAGLMVHQFVRWLRDLRVEPDILMNLLATEMNVYSST